MPPAGAGNVRCPTHFRRSANNRYPPEGEVAGSKHVG
jgi:hypothetical protein